MKTETTVHVSCAEQRVGVSTTSVPSPSWEAFPQPKGWSVDWDSRGLVHEVQSTRARAPRDLVDQV